jgi:tuftelin-interacting protein 11
MARRKRQFLDDGDSDSSQGSEEEASFNTNDPDARAERELFENPYGHKRRRKGGREDAIYGVFGEDSDEEAEGFGGRKAQRGERKKSDWTKAPAFVGGAKVEPSKAIEIDEDAPMDDGDAAVSSNDDEDDADDVDEDEEDTESEGEDESGPSRTRSQSVRDDEAQNVDEQPRMGGIGSGGLKAGLGMSGFSRGGIGSQSRIADEEADLTGPGKRTVGIGFSKGLSGFSKGGIGSNAFTAATSQGNGSSSGNVSSQTSSAFAKGVGSTFDVAAPSSTSTLAPPEDVDMTDLPTSFGIGSASRGQRAFVRNSTSASGSGTATPVQLSARDQAHFASISGSFGARMLAKMGWQAGTGLGTTGTGIVTPVESKLRPKGMGIAFKGFSEKTEQSKSEARRRGEVVSDDEQEKKFKRKGKKAGSKDTQEKKPAVWKRPKKVKTKVEHKTYEEIVAEAGEQAAPSGVGVIIDATGATVGAFGFIP